MSNSRSLFPGAMGPDGFISCFDHLIDDDVLTRKLILKGGPGVGKSTFMRRIHAALCPDGQPSTLYFCSGDPDSLDAVAIPYKGLLILDGTAPHIIDPHYPGARDSIINLGDYLDEAAMRPRLKHIRAVMADHAAAMRRATACLKAAAPLARDNAAIISSALDEAKLKRMTHALIDSVLCDAVPEPTQNPSVRPVITDAVTLKGEICLLKEGDAQRVIRVTGHYAMDFTPMLKAVSSAAQAKGIRVEEHLNPRVPGQLLHITLPDSGTLITTSDCLPSEQLFDFSACLPQGSLLRHECTLEQGRAGVRLHIHRAICALQNAKQLHDELETFYVPCMDFGSWQQRLDKTLASLA